MRWKQALGQGALTARMLPPVEVRSTEPPVRCSVNQLSRQIEDVADVLNLETSKVGGCAESKSAITANNLPHAPYRIW